MSAARAPKHIGIIACSAEGASLCYRTICTEAPAMMGRPYAHPEITMHTPSLARYVAALEAGEWGKVGALMSHSADILCAAGAEILICPDNTIHQALGTMDPFPVPFISIADAVTNEAEARGFTRVGLMGTRWLVESAVYPDALERAGISLRIPELPARRAVDRAIMDELVEGRLDGSAREVSLNVISTLAEAGCEAVILGCTELPLVLGAVEAGLPTLDSTQLLARAALRAAIG